MWRMYQMLTPLPIHRHQKPVEGKVSMTATHHQPTREDIAALAALLREYHTLVAQGLRPMSVADEATWEERLTDLQARVAARRDVWTEKRIEGK